jgi:hypothetical protein
LGLHVRDHANANQIQGIGVRYVTPSLFRKFLTDPATGIGNWLVNTFWGQVSNKALGQLGWKFNFIFIAWNLLVTLPTIFFMFKETKQRTLEEIDLLFGRGPDNLAERRNSKDVQMEPVTDGHTEEEVNKA